MTKIVDDMWMKTGKGRWHFVRHHTFGKPSYDTLCHDTIDVMLKPNKVMAPGDLYTSTSGMVEEVPYNEFDIDLRVMRYPPLAISDLHHRDTTVIFSDSDEESICLGCWEVFTSLKLKPGGVRNQRQPPDSDM